MKKEYKKPMIYVEDFTMCQNIAAGCKITEGANQYGGQCGFDASIEDEFGDITPEVLFNGNVGTCTSYVDSIDCQDGPNSYGGYFFS